LTLAAIALDDDELAVAVKRTLMINEAARMLCRYYGPQNGCHCKGIDAHCHAHILWEPEGRVVVMGFERMGAFK
jgi:hypothetical protein